MAEISTEGMDLDTGTHGDDKDGYAFFCYPIRHADRACLPLTNDLELRERLSSFGQLLRLRPKPYQVTNELGSP